LKEEDFVTSSDSVPAGDATCDQSYLLINGVIVDLKQVIEQIDRDSKKAKDLIAEIARRLDEGRFCESSHISRRIKEMLQDKIKEGKITSKWIEDCLPQQYKRKYTSKSEVTSLSKNDTDTRKEKILIDTAGRSSSLKTGSFDGMNNSEENESIPTPIKQEMYETDCVRCTELEDALLRASSAVPGDKIQNGSDKRHCIPKDKYDLVLSAIKSSEQFCYVIFDKEGTLIYAEPDISKDKNEP